MRTCTLKMIRISAVMVASLMGASAQAQPTQFVNLGTLTPPASPSYARQTFADSELLPAQTLTVHWVRFEIAAPIANDLYLELDSRNYTDLPITFALYNNTGALVVADDTDGSFGNTAGLSFGSTAERVPWVGPVARGQDGPLAVGVYWLAVVAGSQSEITLGPTWGVSTPRTYEVGFDEGQLFAETGVFGGNLTAFPRPGNDDCANAVTITENAGLTPAWSGTSLGASGDAASTCHPNVPNLSTKDVWLNYVPSLTGWVTMTLSGGSGGAITPILTRYSAGCGSSQVRCAGGGSFASNVGTRLTFPVVAGEPVLLSAALRAGEWGAMSLSITPVGAPCNLQTPANSIREIESECGSNSNDGCIGTLRNFDLIQLGETVSGRLFNTRTSNDIDYFSLVLSAPTTFRITARSQLPFDVLLRTVNSAGCPGTIVARASSLSYADLCQPITITQAAGGRFLISISHNARDEFNCTTEYGEYWISIDDVACELPTYTTQPTSVQVCAGGTATFTAATNGTGTEPRGWEWERTTGGTPVWIPVSNGIFSAAGSAATLSGATTGTLQISGVDAAAAVRFRATVQACAVAPSRPAALSLQASAACTCRADFNGDQTVSVPDIFAFLGAFFDNSITADVDNSGSVTVQDVFAFLVLWFAGCP